MLRIGVSGDVGSFSEEAGLIYAAKAQGGQSKLFYLIDMEGVLAALSKDEIDELLNALLSISKWNEIYYLWRPNLKDEGDNHIVELAVASNSKYIITNNKKDFLDKELNFEFEIVTAKEFLQKEFYNECNNI